MEALRSLLNSPLTSPDAIKNTLCSLLDMQSSADSGVDESVDKDEEVDQSDRPADQAVTPFVPQEIFGIALQACEKVRMRPLDRSVFICPILLCF